MCHNWKMAVSIAPHSDRYFSLLLSSCKALFFADGNPTACKSSKNYEACKNCQAAETRQGGANYQGMYQAM